MRTIFKDFLDREEKLTAIVRYHKYNPMFYRTNLWKHSNRLTWLIDALTPTITSIYPDFDAQRAKMMAAVHDDPEMIIGDIQFGHKLVMTEEQLADISNMEQDAIAQLGKEYPETVAGFSYTRLMSDYEHLDPSDLEGVIVKYVDKMDAFCEAWHELHAGNGIFATGFGTDIKHPVHAYLFYFAETFHTSYPLFKPLQMSHPFFFPIHEIEIEPIVTHGTKHTPDSVRNETGNRHYDFWKKVTLQYGGDEGMTWLTKVLEH